MVHLVLVRHGESVWNSENKYTGWADVELSDNGKREALDAGEILKNFSFTKAYTSKLKRARTTLEVILKSTRNAAIPITTSEALNERNFGDLEGWEKSAATKHFGQTNMNKWLKSFDCAPPGGETMNETYVRVFHFFHTEILNELKRGKSAILVAHGNVLRSLITVIEKRNRGNLFEIEVGNAKPFLYEFCTEKGSFRIVH